VTRSYLEIGGEPERLTAVEQITSLSGLPYILLSPHRGQWWLWRNVTGFHQQFVRRVCAQAMGIEAYFDWRRHPFKENMLLTKQILGEAGTASIFRTEIAFSESNPTFY
jgi:hypothetical protein